jgi:hypothetical protein
MRIWPALLAAPALALIDQVVSFATVHWACAHPQSIAIHAVHAFFLVAAAASTVPAFRVWRRATAGMKADEGVARRHFLAGLAVGVGALSVAIIASMWMPTWIIAPCVD